MAVEKEIIKELTNKFGKDNNDTGSTEAQIAILTERINNITSHLKLNKNSSHKNFNYQSI